MAADEQEELGLDPRTEAIVAAVTARVMEQFTEAIFEPLGKLTSSIVDATNTVRRERRGRRISNTLAVIAVVAVFSLVIALVWVKVDRNIITCDTRRQSRTEQRQAMEAGSSAASAASIQVVFDYFEVPQADRQVVSPPLLELRPTRPRPPWRGNSRPPTADRATLGPMAASDLRQRDKLLVIFAGVCVIVAGLLIGLAMVPRPQAGTESGARGRGGRARRFGHHARWRGHRPALRG